MVHRRCLHRGKAIFQPDLGVRSCLEHVVYKQLKGTAWKDQCGGDQNRALILGRFYPQQSYFLSLLLADG